MKLSGLEGVLSSPEGTSVVLSGPEQPERARDGQRRDVRRLDQHPPRAAVATVQADRVLLPDLARDRAGKLRRRAPVLVEERQLRHHHERGRGEPEIQGPERRGEDLAAAGISRRLVAAGRKEGG